MRTRPLVIVFARAPQLGGVKTRLARGIGASGALRFHRLTLATILRRLARDRRWDLCIAATPARVRRRQFGSPSARVALMAQGGGDLGRRMLAVLRRAARRPAMIVGCDIPQLDAAAIGEALRCLASRQVVLGPSRDGGYWLIGWRGVPPSPRLFDGVRWSSRDARADTIARLGARRLGLVRQLDDVDEAADLERLRPSPSACA